MRVILCQNAQEMASFASKQVIKLVNAKPQAVLGLATGSSPLALYAQLSEAVNQGQVDLGAITTFNLDEYVGLSPDHPQSYHYFMQQHLFTPCRLKPHQSHLPQGSRTDLQQACNDYEALIRQAGGIDLQILGLGENGHIGFNEPLSSFGSTTRIKTLSLRTIAANARFFAKDEFQPHLALTMGIASILRARQIMLLATGANKAQAVAQMIEGPMAALCPASALQWHPNVIVLLDPAAASGLELRGELIRSEHYQRQFEA